ncbi:LysR family transcriptional regulator [Oleiharenicola lentus]|uniref:LysR family transcriptional regulator n=1 Tax=Oleiharenicola lentus TaxID=2508720 RepID=UPI003F6802FB
MELRHLRTFVVAAETLNISAAARQLRVTQPALSRQIRELEHSVGHSLFVRHPGGLRLTAAGVELKSRGGQAIEAFDLALRSVREEGTKEPAVMHVGYYATIDTWAKILVPALDKIGRRFHETKFSVSEMTCAQLVTGLREGRIDVAVLGPGDYPHIPGITIELACQFPAAVLVPSNHRLAKKRQIDLEEIRDEEVISLSEESSPGRNAAFIAACAAVGFTPRITYLGSSIPEAISAGIQRQAIGIAGSFVMNAPCPGVAFLKIKPPGVLLNLYVAYAENSTAARYLGELIGTEARRVVGRV